MHMLELTTDEKDVLDEILRTNDDHFRVQIVSGTRQEIPVPQTHYIVAYREILWSIISKLGRS